ncbi:hypothetical protein LR948_07310 [Roseivivax sp. GX 12232]|uniref:ImuA family protein n=1 Tax=Roseivivax sp. GX 12232 TaxID=2900547 RepID=UPI001E3032FD|nr:hypothetical protein [Roseivivax sp. GX 12232]MCE0505155.1 hypothetical protein [Roseivivax sp. GX 12232]
MPDTLLARKPQTAAPALTLVGDIRLTEGRVHEACGLGRHAFAAALAGRCTGAVVWIGDAEAAGLAAEGLAPYCDPGRLLFVAARRPADRLWALEETLRSGATALAVADLDAPPALTPVRRLQLAAEAGSQGGLRPTGLLLTPDPGGAAGVESRWRLTPEHAPARTRWQAERLRARMAPPRAFTLSRGPGAPANPAWSATPYSSSSTA